MPGKSFYTHSIALFILFIISTKSASAQYDDLQKDPNIPWIAEFSMDHDFSIKPDPEPKNIVKLIKLYDTPSNLEGANSDTWAIRQLLQNAFDGHYECYKDSELKQRISIDELKLSTTSVDTIITFDAETHIETVQIVKSELDFSTTQHLRTKQIIYYNQKTGNFETRLIAIAPLQSTAVTNAQLPLFWIKMDTTFPNNFNIHAPNISWGVLIDTKGNPFDLNLATVVKNENNFDFSLFLQQQAFDLKKQVESGKGFGCNKFLNKKEVESLYSAVDTIITFDPNTFQETVKIEKYTLDPKDIADFRLVQEWYYDSEKKMMMNRLKAICPLFFINTADGSMKYVQDGTRRYAKPLYFIRYN